MSCPELGVSFAVPSDALSFLIPGCVSSGLDVANAMSTNVLLLLDEVPHWLLLSPSSLSCLLVEENRDLADCCGFVGLSNVALRLLGSLLVLLSAGDGMFVGVTRVVEALVSIHNHTK
jgi:hypothetical protein